MIQVSRQAMPDHFAGHKHPLEEGEIPEGKAQAVHAVAIPHLKRKESPPVSPNKRPSWDSSSSSHGEEMGPAALRFFRTLPEALNRHLNATGNRSIAQAGKLSEFVLKRHFCHIKTVQKEKRLLIANPRVPLENFFQTEHLNLPGFARIKELVEEISTYNEQSVVNPQTHSRMIEAHSELRHLLFYYQCVAFYKMDPDRLFWEGAKIQLYQGHYKEAAHHTLLPHLNDTSITSIKREFEREFEKAVEGQIPLNPALIIQMLCLGVDPAILEREYRLALSQDGDLHESVELIFKNCAKKNLLDLQGLFYYINSHTLIASPNLNRLDDILEDGLRDTAMAYLRSVAAGKITPEAAAKLLAQKMEDTYRQVEKELPPLAQTLYEISKAIKGYMDTPFGPSTNLSEKIAVVRNFAAQFANLDEKMGLPISPAGKRMYNTVYKIPDRSAPVIDPRAHSAVKELILTCEQFLQKVTEREELCKKIQEYPHSQLIQQHISDKRKQGIYDIKIRQKALQKYIVKGDSGAIAKYAEYQQRIQNIENEQYHAQASLQDLSIQHHKNVTTYQTLEKELNSEDNSAFNQLVQKIIQVTPFLEPYQPFNDVSALQEVLSFLNAQKMGTRKFNAQANKFPSADDSHMEALQSLLIAKNIEFQ